MAIRFEDKRQGGQPARKEVNGKTYVAEEPAPSEQDGRPAATPKKKPPRARPGSAQPA